MRSALVLEANGEFRAFAFEWLKQAQVGLATRRARIAMNDFLRRHVVFTDYEPGEWCSEARIDA